MSLEIHRAGVEIGDSRIPTMGDHERCQGGVVSKLGIAISGAVLFIATQSVVAQHQHGGAAPSGGGNLAGYSPAAADFQRAIDLQATETQSMQIRSWVLRTSALTQQLEAIRSLATSGKTGSLVGDLEMLRAALVTDNLDRQQFLATLSKPQRSGLKKSIGQLDKVDRALAKVLSNLTSSGQDQNARSLGKGLHEASKAILLERHEQREMAGEMGVAVQEDTVNGK
jgi:hypothetical protein